MKFVPNEISEISVPILFSNGNQKFVLYRNEFIYGIEI